MQTKILSLLSLLLGVLALVLFTMERRRVRSAASLGQLQERIEHAVPAPVNFFDRERAAISDRIRAVRALTQPSAGKRTHELNGVRGPVRQAAEASWKRHRSELIQALEIQQGIPDKPWAAAMHWRWKTEGRFDALVTRPLLAGRLRLSGKRLARVRRELLEEFYELWREPNRQVDARRRRETDRRIRQHVYAGDDAGYKAYERLRRDMAKRRRAGQPPPKR